MSCSFFSMCSSGECNVRSQRYHWYGWHRQLAPLQQARTTSAGVLLSPARSLHVFIPQWVISKERVGKLWHILDATFLQYPEVAPSNGMKLISQTVWQCSSVLLAENTAYSNVKGKSTIDCFVHIGTELGSVQSVRKTACRKTQIINSNSLFVASFGFSC